jgi:hypothetical protein
VHTLETILDAHVLLAVDNRSQRIHRGRDPSTLCISFRQWTPLMSGS